MAPLTFLVAIAVAGGQVTFAGAVATPTAASVTIAAQPDGRSTVPITAKLGRFDGPPRVVSMQPRDSAEDHSEIVVTYL